MATVTLKGSTIKTIGSLPELGSKLPTFNLTSGDLSNKTNTDFEGKKLVLNIFPSIDTGTCAASVRRFNSEATKLGKDVVVLCISRDLPFAQGRFCSSEGLENVVNLSSMKDESFGKDFGVQFIEGPLQGLFSRSVIVCDSEGVVKYTQQVAETTEEPDYEPALAAL